MGSLDTLLEKIRSLRGDLSSDDVIQEEKSHEEYAVEETSSGHGMSTWDYAAGDSWVPKLTVIDQPRITKAEAAKKELRQIYNSSDFKEARKIAGEALDYSDLRIWAHEHPVAATLTGISIAGIASVWIYSLVEYLSK